MAKKTDFDDEDFSGNDNDQKPSAGGPLSRLPIAGILGSTRDFFSNLVDSVREVFENREKPLIPLAMLGGIVLILVVILVALFVALGSALSQPTGAAKTPTTEEKSEKMAASNEMEMVEERSMGVDLGIRDPFLTKAILLNEPLFMSLGEIHYQRVPKENWSLSDIAPGWQDLGTVYKTMLRERNSADFHRLMGEEPPPLDRY